MTAGADIAISNDRLSHIAINLPSYSAAVESRNFPAAVTTNYGASNHFMIDLYAEDYHPQHFWFFQDTCHGSFAQLRFFLHYCTEQSTLFGFFLYKIRSYKQSNLKII